jgi:hypothetical protein
LPGSFHSNQPNPNRAVSFCLLPREIALLVDSEESNEESPKFSLTSVTTQNSCSQAIIRRVSTQSVASRRSNKKCCQTCSPQHAVHHYDGNCNDKSESLSNSNSSMSTASPCPIH